MKAGKDKVIALHYTLTVDGEKVESSHDRDEQLWVLLGHGQLIPGLESALEGHEAGDTLQVDVSAADGYGERQEDQIQRMSKKYFPQANRSSRHGHDSAAEGRRPARRDRAQGRHEHDRRRSQPSDGRQGSALSTSASATCVMPPRKSCSTATRMRRALKRTDCSFAFPR
jgi:hypothetical protein